MRSLAPASPLRTHSPSRRGGNRPREAGGTYSPPGSEGGGWASANHFAHLLGETKAVPQSEEGAKRLFTKRSPTSRRQILKNLLRPKQHMPTNVVML